jgi:hypothetical protein
MAEADFALAAALLPPKVREQLLQARRLREGGLGAELSKDKTVKAAQVLADAKVVQVKKLEGQLEQAKARAVAAINESASLADKLVLLRKECDEAAAKAREALAAQRTRVAAEEAEAAAAAAEPRAAPAASLESIQEAIGRLSRDEIAKLGKVLAELSGLPGAAAAAGAPPRAPVAAAVPVPSAVPAAAQQVDAPKEEGPGVSQAAQQVWQDITCGIEDPAKREAAEQLLGDAKKMRTEVKQMEEES